MNIVKLWFPEQMGQFADAIAELLQAHEEQAPGIDIKLVTTLAVSEDHVTIALTDDRWNVIAFGCMNLNTGNIEASVRDPKKNFLGDLHDDVKQNLHKQAEQRRIAA